MNEASLAKLGGGNNTIIVDEILEGEKGYAKGPERSLFAALLFDGIQSYFLYANLEARASAKHREAYNWVHSGDSEYVFSFDNTCEALGIDPGFLRYGLLNACNSSVVRKRKRRTF